MLKHSDPPVQGLAPSARERRQTDRTAQSSGWRAQGDEVVVTIASLLR